jgi:transcriptional regulator GlxA family with amidase domain
VEVSAGDYIFIPGSDVAYLNSEELSSEKALFDWVVAAYDKKVTLCTICTGAFFLASTGLLDGKNCTTHWKRTAELQEKYPRLRVLENILYTEDDRIYTSAGVTSGIDMALFIIGKIKDDYLAYKIARELVVYNRRPGNQTQQSIFLNYRNHIHSCIHRVQDWLQENIDQKVTLEELAEIACMSIRTLTRTFKKETSISVNEYITLIRKERIQELMKNPDMTRAQIARKCGLKSERQVTRIIKKETV